MATWRNAPFSWVTSWISLGLIVGNIKHHVSTQINTNYKTKLSLFWAILFEHIFLICRQIKKKQKKNKTIIMIVLVTSMIISFNIRYKIKILQAAAAWMVCFSFLLSFFFIMTIRTNLFVTFPLSHLNFLWKPRFRCIPFFPCPSPRLNNNLLWLFSVSC